MAGGAHLKPVHEVRAGWRQEKGGRRRHRAGLGHIERLVGWGHLGSWSGGIGGEKGRRVGGSAVGSGERRKKSVALLRKINGSLDLQHSSSPSPPALCFSRLVDPSKTGKVHWAKLTGARTPLTLGRVVAGPCSSRRHSTMDGGSPSFDHSGTLEGPPSPSLAPTSPSLSARSHSIRRKPPPSNDDHTDATRSPVSESRSSAEYEGRDGPFVGQYGGREGDERDRGGVPGPSVHSFPPQPHSASTRAPYASTNPKMMSAAASGAAGHADESPTRSSANSLHDATTELNAQGPAYPTLANRTSIHSQRSSVAPESVFGTAPTGVIGRHKPREIVRIERDYSGGELCQFWSGWIWELEGRVRAPFAGLPSEIGG